MITVNGVEQTAFVGKNVTDLLTHLVVDSEHVVVERNGVIVKREAYETITLEDQDEIEVISFVGGG